MTSSSGHQASVAPAPALRALPRKLGDWAATLLPFLLFPLLILPLAAQTSGPSLSISPSTALAGQRITVVGRGFAPRQDGVIAVDIHSAGLPTFRADRNGSFSVAFTLSSSISTGSHQVDAIGSSRKVLKGSRSSSGVVLASSTLIVGMPASTSPSASRAASPTPVSIATPASTATPRSTPLPSATVTPTAATTPAPNAPQPVGRVRAAFYYPWFPETWTVKGAHVRYHPDLGYYDSRVQATIDGQIRAMDYAKIQVAIVSWWGSSSPYDGRVRLLLDRIAALGSPLRVAFYYEKEGFGNPSQAQVSADLSYLQATYGAHPSTRRPLTVFVYNADDTTCAVADKWKAANTVGAYIDLKVFSGYATCAAQPQGWHQYGPASREQNIGTSFAISPGFWRADEGTARLARDVATFRANVRDMVASGKQWQLVTTFNEWGEGTAVEGATEWESPSGFGAYLDALHSDGVSP